MLAATSVFTYELDDPALALEEIQTQLNQQITLQKNTVGILMCDPEFITAGVYAHLCENLPFPIAGASTMSQVVNAEGGVLMLTLMVLTSDDVAFASGMTDAIERGGANILPATSLAYHEAASNLPEPPKLAIIFPPLLAENAGDAYVEAFDALCPGVPVFGTVAIDDTLVFDSCYCLHNGLASQDALSFILISGNITPRFLVGALGNNNALPYTGEITKSQGHIVHEINNQRAVDYFTSIGMAKDGKLDEGLQFVPFLLDFTKRADHDGIPVVRAMLHFDEDGRGVCRGYMYENSIFTLTNPSADDVFQSSTELVDRINEMPGRQAVIVFSCMVRRMTFGTEPLREIEMMRKKMEADVPFMMAYAGGEICPTSVREDSVTNRFHNYSMIACIL